MQYFKYSVNKFQDGKKIININAYDSLKDINFIGRIPDEETKNFWDESETSIINKITDKKLSINYINCTFKRKKSVMNHDFKIQNKNYTYLLKPSWDLSYLDLERSEDGYVGSEIVRHYNSLNIFQVVDDVLEDIEEGLC